jgi:hypothetical protein
MTALFSKEIAEINVKKSFFNLRKKGGSFFVIFIASACGLP